VPQDFINETEFNGKDVGIDYKSVLALATVSREAFVSLNKFVSFNRRSGKPIN
jgi:hypothetical protein